MTSAEHQQQRNIAGWGVSGPRSGGVRSMPYRLSHLVGHTSIYVPFKRDLLLMTHSGQVITGA